MEKFGVILRKLRKEKHMSQKELANKLFKAESTIRMWELGINQPDNDTLVDLSHMFDVSTDYLLGVSDIRNNTDLKDNLNKIKESGQYEVNTDLTDEELEANLEELLS
jgi:transcriptional regulator with XRE-family HTH domain